ncbi:hypothetical protein BU24DRAFT_466987 [Aaosphaeria arxii CBS 175.79]|uniref:Uncharacterized protein n=1 Tax=Aaosphaeria arxii CBS 175.79 TaxID=1450172 RepID=A0A6A5XC27_9PLEO|nr:uncharacterized protein BU24DRAFT_466987 [Aaosphaeria arxii CBS 175.79]KAF2010334.1 hypothetical protein BU24DRAFT_466987 [Aaosphaeria arxii CBS 175.79]
MSYADVAAKGPKQSPEESLSKSPGRTLVTSFNRPRAPAIPEVENSDDSVHSLVDVDSPHVSSVPSDFESQSVKTDTQAERIELEERAKQRAAEAKEKAKSKSQKGKNYAKENADNPVILGNTLAVGILGTALGVGAYRKYVKDELTWKVVGAWAGFVGLFAVGDYYVSQYFFKRYPTKK